MSGELPREGASSCECWEIDVEPDELEGLIAELREESPEAIIQVFGASRSPNVGAVEMIAAQTLRAATSASTLADRPELDLLLRLAGTRQIGDAIRRVGYKSKAKRLFMVAVSAGTDAALSKIRRRASNDSRFSPVARKPPGKGDLELVERAALLASKL